MIRFSTVDSTETKHRLETQLSTSGGPFAEKIEPTGFNNGKENEYDVSNFA